MDVRDAPEAAFLGFAERAGQQYEPGSQLLKWNALGIKSIIPVLFTPTSFAGFSVVLAFQNAEKISQCEFFVVSSDRQDIGGFNVATERNLAVNGNNSPETSNALSSSGLVSIEVSNIKRDGPLMMISRPGSWTIVFLPLRNENAPVIWSEGEYTVECSINGLPRKRVGHFYCVVVEIAPLGVAEINAIRSNPGAVKSARLQAKCTVCHSSLSSYVSINRDDAKHPGYVWHEALSDNFICSCGKLNFSTRSLKKNLPSVLGENFGSREDLIAVPLYEAHALDTIKTDFQKLIDRNPREEDVQKFLEQNTIIFHQFSPKKLLMKPPILSKFNADFAIVSSNKTLYLIEIERPSINLIKKSTGGQHSDLTHAIEQVRMWMHEIAEFKHAVLSNIDIKLDEVSDIKGIVIAGREAGNDAAHLRRLKSSRDIEILTYDDLLSALSFLAASVRAV